MDEKTQLELWCKGINVHDEENGRCCPDFACCQKDEKFHSSIEKREMFKAAFETGVEIVCAEMLTEAMGLLLKATLRDSSCVHIILGNQKRVIN